MKTVVFPPLVSVSSYLKKLKRENSNIIAVKCKLLNELTNSAFRNLVKETIKQSRKATLVFCNADLLFPLGAYPFLYLENLKEERPKLSFIFLINENIKTERLYKRFFKIPMLYENISYSPLSSKNIPFKNKTQAKSFLLSLNNNQNRILRLLVRGAEDKDMPNSLRPDVEYLENLNIIRRKRNKRRLFSPLLESAALEITQGLKEPLKLKGDKIFIAKQDISGQFSPSQRKVLRFLLENKAKTVSRDKIASLLWGKDYLERYSDWAIDQIIYKLRKKLVRLWISPNIIVSKKKKGVALRLNS
jgi:hypothetical protein